MHAAWAYQQGLLPFRDFFEHHMPGIYYLLSPLMRGFDVAGQPAAATSALLAARTAICGFAGVIVAATVWLGAQYGGAPVGWLAGALLSLCIVFVARTLEIRPDVPAAALWTVSQALLVSALAQRDSRRTRWIASGLLLGFALSFTQKALLAGPGFALFALLYLAVSSERKPSSKIADLAAFVAAAAAPLAGIAAHYWANGATRALWTGVLTNNLGWPQESTAASTIHWMLLRDPLFCALAVGGAVTASAAAASEWRRGTALWRTAIFLPTISLFAGLWLIPAPFPQYLLLVFPAAAVFGADFLCSVLWSLSGRDEPLPPSTAIAVAGSILTAVIGLAIAQPFYRHIAFYPLAGALAVGAAWVCVRRSQPAYACAVVIVAVSVYSAQQLVWMKGLSNAPALAAMTFVHQATSPDDRVMDGFSGLGWFRQQASFFWFTAPGVRPRMSAADKTALVEMVACGPQPKVVILDRHLASVDPRLAREVTRHFRETPYTHVYIRDPSRPACTAGP